MVLVALLAVTLVVEARQKSSKLNASELEVLRYLEVRDTPSGETGPKSFHSVTSGASKHQPILVLEKEENGLLHFALRVRGDSPMETPESLHPMTPAHWIETVFVLDEHDNVVFSHAFKQPSSNDGQEALSRFTVPAEGPRRELRPFEFCNLHGLWQGPSVQVGTGAVADALDRDETI